LEAEQHILNDKWGIDEIKEEIKRFLKGKFIAMNAHIKRTKRSQINDLIL
jgi:hypothetical protein